MAEIDMERRPRRSVWVWVAAAILVAVIAVAAWFYLVDRPHATDMGPAAERPGIYQPAPDRPGDPAPVEPYGPTPPADPARPRSP